jgi:ZIP family zinc transporter
MREHLSTTTPRPLHPTRVSSFARGPKNHSTRSQPVAEGNVELAFGLVIAAGLCTTVGSTFVFCSSYANTKVLACSLGVSAGVMLYVSFVEIFAVKSVEGFSAAYPDRGNIYATLCFFGGILATTVLDSLVHAIGRYQRDKKSDAIDSCDRRAAAGDRSAFGKTPSRDASGGKSSMRHPERDPANMLAGERALWSDAAAATHEEAISRTCSAGKDVELGGGSSASSTTSEDGTCLKRANTRTSFEDFRVEPPETAETMSGLQSSQVELLTSVKHGVTHEVDTPNKEHLKNMGLMTALAIAIHNFPEGLATFVAALADMKLGLALAVAVAVHNIPEGACVAMPVYYATGSKLKGFWWSFVSGISEPIGGLFGYLVLYGNGMSDVAYGALFGIVGGMMVYISLKELLPTALKYDPRDTCVTNCMFGGMAIMALSLILFQI